MCLPTPPMSKHLAIFLKLRKKISLMAASLIIHHIFYSAHKNLLRNFYVHSILVILWPTHKNEMLENKEQE